MLAWTTELTAPLEIPNFETGESWYCPSAGTVGVVPCTYGRYCIETVLDMITITLGGAEPCLSRSLSSASAAKAPPIAPAPRRTPTRMRAVLVCMGLFSFTAEWCSGPGDRG